MKSRTLVLCLISGLWPALLMSGHAWARTPKPKLTLSSSLGSGGSLLSLGLRPTGDLAPCTVTVYAGASKSALKRLSGVTTLSTLGGLAVQQSLQANNLGVLFSSKRHPRKKSAYLRAVAACPSKTLLSSIKTVKVPASNQGTLGTIADWIAQLPGALQQPAVTIALAQPQLTFSSPVDLQNAGDDRLFVVEQAGIIKVFHNVAGATASTFLDIRSKVKASGEQGLLSLAFHPNYKTNGIFFVHYSEATNGNTTIARYQVMQNNPDAADPSSEQILLSAVQPFANHNGGQISFGPDGYLYIGLGDGGSGGDPLGNGQNKTTVLGKILRIDVNATQGQLAYAIPPTNPFAGNTSGFREEIFAVGMRNPWKTSFDPVTGNLWCGDVGQNAHEEVDIIVNGANYGWNTMEGDFCYPSGNTCDQTGLTLPVLDYSHSEGNSITGGYVYRGTANPSLIGKYVYGDFISGKIWSLLMTGGAAQNTLLFDTSYAISTFGRDVNGELYFFDYSSGRLYVFVPQ